MLSLADGQGLTLVCKCPWPYPTSTGIYDCPGETFRSRPWACARDRVCEEAFLPCWLLTTSKGASLFRNLDVDLLVTGELSHHDTLAAIEQGKCVIARMLPG